MASDLAISGNAPVAAMPAAPRAVPTRPSSTTGPAAPAPETGSAAEAAAQVGQHLQAARPELRLQVDAGSGRTVFRVIQQGTGQVVLQVPSEEILGMSRRLREAEGSPGPSGTLLDKKG